MHVYLQFNMHDFFPLKCRQLIVKVYLYDRKVCHSVSVSMELQTALIVFHRVKKNYEKRVLM